MTTDQKAVELALHELHGSLDTPFTESMNLLNEVSYRYLHSISLAAGRPHEGFFDPAVLPRYIETFREHLRAVFKGNEYWVNRTLLQYGRTKGVIHDLIAKHLEIDEKITVDPETIVVTVGCQEALYLTVRALRRTEKDALLAVFPCYFGVSGAAELADMPVLAVKDSADGVDVDDLVAVVTKAKADGLRPRALYLVPDFANPTGTTIPAPVREKLLALADEHDFLIIEDNPYGLLTDDPEQPRTLKAMDTNRRVVYCSSFAKSGIPAARVGYVIADQVVTGGKQGAETLSDQLARIKSMLTVNTSPIAQAVIGGKLIENDFSLRAANVRETRIYLGNLEVALKTLTELFPDGSTPEVTWNVPRGGFFVILTVPFAVTDEMLARCGRDHDVLWTPMHHFYGDGVPRNQIRISISAVNEDEIRTGLASLARFLKEEHDSQS
ncbi:GntR family transcriptional regulator [Amycolatopsis sp. WAC 01375]|uniref:aminotransferase-like domain-containing protein n=1 Tax=Amycolatopsis sp. WAC 01375 TaxID=2203194 RepID=UPI000F797269|nr:PLP-dependent aminotransferase family protein [Amycolatopsis sp. WAC 01375]RSM80760.1 GntR family transcriptional regulator [Amycolatopsis sp. WAC 01375]